MCMSERLRLFREGLVWKNPFLLSGASSFLEGSAAHLGGSVLGRISSGGIGKSVLEKEGTLEASILLREVHEKVLSKKEASLEVFLPWEQE